MSGRLVIFNFNKFMAKGRDAHKEKKKPKKEVKK